MRRIVLKRLGLFACDLSVIAVSGVLALLLRDNFETTAEQAAAFLPYVAITILVGAGCILLLGLQRGIWRLSVMGDYLRIVTLCVVTVALSMTFLALDNRLGRVARAVPIIHALLLIVGLVGLRVAARIFFNARNRRRPVANIVPDFTPHARTVLLVGLNRLTQLYIRSIEDLAAGRIRIAGIVTEHAAKGSACGGYAVLGRPAEARQVVDHLAVQGIFVSHIVVVQPKSDLRDGEVRALSATAQARDIEISYLEQSLGLLDAELPEATATAAGSARRPAGAVASPQLWQHAQRPYWRLKRLVDMVGSALLLLLLAPVFALVGVLVACDVGAPVIFWQQRPGARGIPFRVYKFRTMRGAFDDQGHRVADAERVSAVGHLLRATRLDELPQLFNVLTGQMSLIGPRPLLPVDQFPGLEARLAIAPGITGWAQINGGRQISAGDKAALDLWYLQNASLKIDCRILAATAATIWRGEQTNLAAIDEAWATITARDPALPAASHAAHHLLASPLSCDPRMA